MTVHDNNTYVPPTGSHQSPATKNTDTCIRHPRQSLVFKNATANIAFHFCQWYAAPSTDGSKDSDTALLCIDEHAIEQRFAQFTKAVAGKPSTRRRDPASLVFERFL